MATKADLLADAEAALHRLMTGQAVVEFRDQNGEQIRYTLANRGALQAYVELLRREVYSIPAGGPARVWF